MPEHDDNQQRESWANSCIHIMQAGVKRAQEENRQLGVPNVYSINGILYYELPDGSLSREDPWQGKDAPPDAAGEGVQ